MTLLTGTPAEPEPQFPYRGAARLHWIEAYIVGSEDQITAVIDKTKNRYGSHDQWAGKEVRTNPSKNAFGLTRGSRYVTHQNHIAITTNRHTFSQFIVTGQGCDLIADRSGTSAYDEELWKEELLWLQETGWSFSRLDIALDDQSGVLDFPTIYQHSFDSTDATKPPIRSKQRQGRLKNQTLVGDTTIYFGTKAGKAALNDFGIRIYDQDANKDSRGTGVRVEVQVRKGQARKLASEIIRFGLDIVRPEIMLRVNFRDFNPDDESDPKTWPHCTWWVDFLAGGKVAPIKSSPKPKTDYDKQLTHLLDTYGSTLALMLGTPMGVSRLSRILDQAKDSPRKRPERETMKREELRSNARELNGKPFDTGAWAHDLARLVGPWIYLMVEAANHGEPGFAELVEQSRNEAERLGISIGKDDAGIVTTRAVFIYDSPGLAPTTKAKSPISIKSTKGTPRLKNQTDG